MLQQYPTELSRNLVPYLYDIIASILPSNPQIFVLFASRHLKRDLKGGNFIDALKAANEELLEATQKDTTNMDSVYAEWLVEQFNALGDPNLVRGSFLGASKVQYWYTSIIAWLPRIIIA